MKTRDQFINKLTDNISRYYNKIKNYSREEIIIILNNREHDIARAKELRSGELIYSEQIELFYIKYISYEILKDADMIDKNFINNAFKELFDGFVQNTH